MTESIVLLIVILTTGLLAATPGLLALWQPQGNGHMLSLMRTLSECLAQKDDYAAQIAELRREMAVVLERVDRQADEIVSLRNVIVSMSTAPSRSSRSQARTAGTVEERRRDIWQRELNMLHIQLAQAQAQKTESGPDVHIETQIEKMRDRIGELEEMLDAR